MKNSGAPALAIQLLGGFHVRVRDKLVAEARWPRRQAKQLVKLLALAPLHQLHRQQLIDAICPDLNAESGAASLHKIIHLARHALEPSLKAGAKSQFIMTHEQHVQLRAPGGLWIDVEKFERLADAAMRSCAVSDYERGKISPGVAALQRLLSAMEYRMSDIETVSDCIEKLRKVLPVPDSEGLAKQVQLSTGSRIASGLSRDIDGGFEAVFVLIARLQREVLLVMNRGQASEKATET